MANNSFLPEDYLERRAQRRTNLLSLVLFAVVMGGVVGAFFVTDRQRLDVRRMQQQVNKEFEDAAKRLEQLDDLQGRKDKMVRKAKVTSVLLERVPRSLILSEIVNAMPGTLSLLDFRLDTTVVRETTPYARTLLEKAQADKAQKDKEDKEKQEAEEGEVEVLPTRVAIHLVGVAPTDVQVAQFMTAMGKIPLFKEINLAYSEEITVGDQTLRKFSVDMRLNQDLDLKKIEPLMVKRELKQNPMGSTTKLDPTASPTYHGAPRAVPAAGRLQKD